MPKRKGKPTGGGKITPYSLQTGRDRTCMVFGKTLQPFQILTGNTTAFISFNPANFGTRLTALGSVFQQFRFKKVRLVLHPFTFGTASASVTSIVIAYAKIPPKGSVTNQNDAYQFPASRIITDDETVPVVMNLSEDILLRGTRSWWECNPASGDDPEDSNQGQFLLVSNPAITANTTFSVEIGYELELRAPCDPNEEGITKIYNSFSHVGKDEKFTALTPVSVKLEDDMDGLYEKFKLFMSLEK